jgi:hypothetical protein
MELYGYSERGLVNALCYDCFHSPDGHKYLGKLLSLCHFPFLLNDNEKPDFANITGATLFVEQTLSDFGDSDLIVLCDLGNGDKAVVFCEFKRGSGWSLQEEWLRFARYVSSLFSVSDIQNLSSLVDKLRQHSDSVATYLFERFSTDAPGLLSTPAPKIEDIVEQLNRIVQGPPESLYAAATSCGVNPFDSLLSKKGKELLAKNPIGLDLRLLNRILLEDTYSLEIKKRRKDITSNLFCQLYFKQRFYTALVDSSDGNIDKGLKFDEPLNIPGRCRKIGDKRTVLEAVRLIKLYSKTAYFLMVVPAALGEGSFREFLPTTDQVGLRLWTTKRWGLLSLPVIEKFCQDNRLTFDHTLDIFQFNRSQLY